jgi:hypothetical protein
MKVSGWFNHEGGNFNLIYGSYEEAGINRILIKQLENILLKDGHHVFINQGNLEASSGIVNVEGVSYGNTQISRLHLVAEQIDKENAIFDPNAKVFLHEYHDDSTEFTTGSYLWKQLHAIGLPFNSHVETVGRIIINGYDIPISKTMITKNKDGESTGDVLLTFDKYFNANTIKGALHENIIQYPGILFFKNKGFIPDAVISTSYDMEGSLTYNDDPQGDLFNTGIHSITASCIVNDEILIIASAYGCVASINIKTLGYTNIRGDSKGDSPPPYYRSYQSTSNPDNIKAIVHWNNKIFVLTNRGYLYKIAVGTNNWEEITNPDVTRTSNPINYLNNRDCKAYAVKDNLLIISWPFGALSSFDMESEIYTPVDSGNEYPATRYDENGDITSDSITGDSITVGRRIYFIGDSATSSGKALCWFDTITKTFGFGKNPPSIIGTRYNQKVDLTTDGSYIYLLVSNVNDATLIEYDIELDLYTVLENTLYPHSQCGIYYHNNKIYALFGVGNGEVKYIQVYNINTSQWMGFIVNQSIPIIYNAKGIIKEGINELTGIRYVKILVFWGTSTNDIHSSEVDFSNIIEVELSNIPNISDAVSIGYDLDIIFNTIRLAGYSLEYDKERNTVYVSNGLIAGTGNLSKNIYRLNLNTHSLIPSQDVQKPGGTRMSISGLFNHNLYNIGGYTNSVGATAESLYIYNVREGTWNTIKSLAYNPDNQVMNGVVPVITSMKIIYPGDMLVLSYMDGSVGSFDLRVGNITLPTSTKQVSLTCIHAPPGIYSGKGAYKIYEDEEDVTFICTDNEFKFAKHVGVFFKKMPKDSTSITMQIESGLPYPVAGCSQIAIGKYILYLNGYDPKEVNYKSTIHRNIIVLDTSTGDYEVLAVDKLVRYKYNAFSHYYNGYICTFGGICKEDQWDEVNQVNETHYVRRAVIERYDLVSGRVTELPVKYGIELNEDVDLRGIGENQVIQLSPMSYFGSHEKDTILGSIITPNDGTEGSDGLKQWFFFDLISETLYNSSSLADNENIPSTSVALLCERKTNKELYSFIFSESSLDRTEHIALSINKHTLDEDLDIKSSKVLELDIKSPLMYQGFISGLCDIVYNEDKDIFVIPCLQKNPPSLSDKMQLSTTIGYEFDPKNGKVSECTRDGTNPIKLTRNSCSIPIDKIQMDTYTQHSPIGLVPIHSIGGKYIATNPTSEVMTFYSKNELFGHKKEKITGAHYIDWNPQQAALYTLFTRKDTPFEVALDVKPDRDACILSHKNSLIRAILIDPSHVDIFLMSTIYDALDNNIQGLVDASLYIIIEYDRELKHFRVLYSEVINAAITHPYSVPTVLVNGILWSFLGYQDENDNSLSAPIISFDTDTHSVGHHNFGNIYTNTYNVKTEFDLPRCIVNAEKELVYIILVNREDVNQGFTACSYTFTGLNYHNHVSDSRLNQIINTWNTSIPQGTGYYLSTSINVNGYILKDKLFIDIFNGLNGEVSYTNHIAIQENGLLDQGLIVVKNFNDFIRGFPLQDTLFLKTFKNSVIQDIIGYKKTFHKGEPVISPIIAIDSLDILKASAYDKVRAFVVLDALSMEIPKAFVSFSYNEEKEYIIFPTSEGIGYIEEAADNSVECVLVDMVSENKYSNFRKSGFLPTVVDISPDTVTKVKTLPLDNDSAISVMTSSGDKGQFFYRFDIKNRMLYSLSEVNYINQSEKNNLDGDSCIIGNTLYCAGRLEANGDYLYLTIYDIHSGLLLDIMNITASPISGVKCVYIPNENAILIFGGTDTLTGQFNQIIFKYDISSKGISPYDVTNNDELNGEITDAYYNEVLNKTFFQLKAGTASTGNFKAIDHITRDIISYNTQLNPISSEKLIETKGKAYAYLNKDFSLSNKAHPVFDPVTLNYIDKGGYSVTGPVLNNIALSEVIALGDKSLFTGISVAPPESPIVYYQSDFTSLDGWEASGMAISVQGSKLKGIVTETLDAAKLYFHHYFGDEIKQCQINITFSGEYNLKDDPVAIVFSDGTEENLKAINVSANSYKFIVYSYYHKAITGIKVHPTYSVIPDRVLYIDSIKIEKIVTNVAPDFQWAIGPLFFANASPSPIEDITSRRLFHYDGNIYLYGKDDRHEIHIFNNKTRTFDIVSDAIHSESNIPDDSFYSSKTYLDGTVRFCFIIPSTLANEIKVAFVLYRMTSRELLGINTVTIPINGNAANMINFNSLAIKPLWVSHYLLFTVTSSNNSKTYLVKIDLSAFTGASYDVTGVLSPKTTLEWFYDRIIALGGSNTGIENNDDNHLDSKYETASFRFNETLIANSVNKVVLPITAKDDIRSSFISVKSGKKISSLFMNALSLTDDQKEAILHLDSTSLDFLSASLAIAGNNGETNAEHYFPYFTKYKAKNFDNELQITAFDDTSYLEDASIKAFHIPYKENKVLIGFYDNIKNPSFSSTLANYGDSIKMRVASVDDDLIGIYNAYEYTVKIYSGVTRDRIVTYNHDTLETIDEVVFERDYGVVISGIEEFEENKFILIYEGNPAIGTAIIHEDGVITVKRYDGSIFGRSIDKGSNTHTIQEVDLTFLFDLESSEYNIRNEGV